MPVAPVGGRHGAAMGAAEKLRGGPTWGPAGGSLLQPGRLGFVGVGGPSRRPVPSEIFRHIRHGATARAMQSRNVAALRQLRQFWGSEVYFFSTIPTHNARRPVMRRRTALLRTTSLNVAPAPCSLNSCKPLPARHQRVWCCRLTTNQKIVCQRSPGTLHCHAPNEYCSSAFTSKKMTVVMWHYAAICKISFIVLSH